MRPVDFSCILRISKSQMLENGTKDAAMDGVYRGVLDYLSTQSHKIAYPELIVPCVMQLKAFLKKSKVANYREVACDVTLHRPVKDLNRNTKMNDRNETNIKRVFPKD